MKTIGLIGGLGPEATKDYYSEIISRFRELNPGTEFFHPEMVIYSVNMKVFADNLWNGRYDEAADYLAACIEKIRKAGADFAAISANTPHYLFGEIQNKSSLPLISIVETARSEAEKQGLKKTGLIGTKFTMKASFYSDSFSRSGIKVVVPEESDIEIINKKLFEELEVGIFRDETRNQLLDIVGKMITHDGIDSLILGCTEFPILFKEESYLGIPFLNTTRIHVRRIVDTCLEN
ncbi:MAG: amino acid racemase [Bacteroidales bacterium]